MVSPFGPFWSEKCLNFRGESCEISILLPSIQETHTMRKVKNQVLLFYRAENEFQNVQGNLII